MRDKVIITDAISGVLANRNQCEAIPYTPAEFAAEAKRSYDAGAAVIHIHAREDDGSPSFRPERYGEIQDAIRAACPVLTNFSTGAIGIRSKADRAGSTSTYKDIACELGSRGSLAFKCCHTSRTIAR